jgi:DNA-binding GntR family transcriptional regulator
MIEREPPYVQIIEHFKKEISAGRLTAGDRLPAGREIAAEFGVSVATAAKVAGGLQAMGLVTALPGSGTVVSAPRPPQARAQGGPLLIRLASRGPVQPGDDTRVLSAEMTTVPQRVAAELGVGPLAPVVCRRLVTSRDGATAALSTSWFPGPLAEAAPDLLTHVPLTGEIAGYQPAWGEDWVSARPPSMEETRTFGIKRGSPVVVVHSRRLDASDTVIEYAELIARADTRLAYRYEYTGSDT